MSEIKLDRVDFHTHVQIGALQRKSVQSKGGEAPCELTYDTDAHMAHVVHIASKRTALVPVSNIAAMYPAPVTQAIVPPPPPVAPKK